MSALRRGLLLSAVITGLVLPAEAGRGNLLAKLKCLNVTMRLNDNSYCPGGVMTGREGRSEGRDDRMRVRIQMKSSVDHDIRIRSSAGAQGRVTCYKVKQSDGKRCLVKIGTSVRYPIRGNFRTSNSRIFNAVFPIPKDEGEYLIRTRVAGSTFDSARFGVWYDRDACPRPGRRPPVPRPQPPPPVAVNIPPPAPVAPSAGLAKCLAVTLNVDWFCSDKDDLVRVTVVNTHASKTIPVSGIAGKGFGNVGAFERQGGDGPLAPGESAIFHACGKVTDGSRMAEAWVSNLPAARDSSMIDVACAPNFDDIN